MNPQSSVFFGDNKKYMSTFPSKYFDLGVIDPPYGIKEDGKSNHTRSHARAHNNGRGKIIQSTKYTPKEWDNEPESDEYFKELFRVTKNQIILGANHFISKIPYDSSCWIVWDKETGGDFADAELAWTSFKTAVRVFKFRWSGMLQENMKHKEKRIHPTQKPVALYKWILQTYAKKGYKILDTHMGSQSSRIAAWDLGFDYWGCENDEEYFTEGCERFEREKSKVKGFFKEKDIVYKRKLKTMFE